MTTPSVLARTATGVGWIVGWRMLTRLLGLVNTLTLVRLLRPSDFGLVALATGFVLAVDTLSTLGVEDALVRERDPSAEMYQTALTLNALRSMLTALVIAVAAHPVAIFFKEPRLAIILYVLAVSSVIEGLSNVGMVQFRRDMAFAKEFQLQVLPRVIGVITTIACAFAFRSFWALVAGILASRFSRVAFSYVMHPMRPRPTLVEWRSLSGFSFWTWAASMAQLTSGRIDGFVIGKVLGPGPVGVYAVGAEIAALPTTELVEPLCRVCFSSFTVARHDGQAVSETYVRVVASAFLLTLPAGIGISAVAAQIVLLAVGTQWDRAVPVIQVLGLVGVPTVFGYVASVLFSAHGMLKRNFSVIVIGCFMRLGLIVPLTLKYGVFGAACGSALAIALDQLLFTVWSIRHFNIALGQLGRSLVRPTIAASVMGALLFSTHLGWAGQSSHKIWAALRHLSQAASAGASVYVAVLLMLWIAAGRPRGAESDILGAILQAAGSARARIRRGRNTAPPPPTGA